MQSLCYLSIYKVVSYPGLYKYNTILTFKYLALYYFHQLELLSKYNYYILL